MTDLPPELLTQLLVALIGCIAGMNIVLRLLPVAARAVGALLDRWLRVLEQWAETNAATATAMTDRAITAELEAQGLRARVADLERMLAAEVTRNNALQVQDAANHQRGKNP